MAKLQRMPFIPQTPKGAAKNNRNSYTNIYNSLLDTLRENCGIIRKQASTDGGVLWKVMCVDVVQVR
ncbi:hypothetical protein TNCV_601281, partial [Trichonephila clavipes]